MSSYENFRIRVLFYDCALTSTISHCYNQVIEFHLLFEEKKKTQVLMVLIYDLLKN